MILHGHPLSSCTRKVLMALHEKGAKADFVTVDLFTGAHKQPEHLARHPFGVIPVLDDDGFVLYESRAIIRYLDGRLPGASLIPADPKLRAKMDQWLSVDQSYIAPHTRTLAIERVLKKHQGQEADRATTEAAESALQTSLGTIDRALGSSDYLAGDALSLADIGLAPYVASLAMLGSEHLIADMKHLRRWWSGIAARPSWLQIL